MPPSHLHLAHGKRTGIVYTENSVRSWGIMARRSTVRAALATVEAADAAASLADLPALLLPALVNLVGAESALWTQLDQAAVPGQATGSCPGESPVIPDRCWTAKRQLPSNSTRKTFR